MDGDPPPYFSLPQRYSTFRSIPSCQISKIRTHHLHLSPILFTSHKRWNEQECNEEEGEWMFYCIRRDAISLKELMRRSGSGARLIGVPSNRSGSPSTTAECINSLIQNS